MPFGIAEIKTKVHIYAAEALYITIKHCNCTNGANRISCIYRSFELIVAHGNYMCALQEKI